MTLANIDHGHMYISGEAITPENTYKTIYRRDL